MVEEREVTKERAIEFAKLHAIHKVFETSAKTGENVEEVFSCAGKELFMQTEKEEEVNAPKEPIKQNSSNQRPKGSSSQGTKGLKGEKVQLGGSSKPK